MTDLLDNLWQLWEALAAVLRPLLALLLRLLPLLLWFGFWLLAVNWRKAWPVLAAGAWIPVVLLAVTAGFVWAHVQPGAGRYLGVLPLPTYYWHLANVSTLVGVALFAGWLQGVLGWAPPEINVDPVVHATHHEPNGRHHGPAHAHH